MVPSRPSRPSHFEELGRGFRDGHETWLADPADQVRSGVIPSAA